MPRISAGNCAPRTPMLERAITAYGMPYLTLGLPVRFTRKLTKNPARMIAAKTHQPLMPAVMNRLAASV